jgi:hypothetical protein
MCRCPAMTQATRHERLGGSWSPDPSRRAPRDVEGVRERHRVRDLILRRRTAPRRAARSAAGSRASPACRRASREVRLDLPLRQQRSQDRSSGRRSGQQRNSRAPPPPWRRIRRRSGRAANSTATSPPRSLSAAPPRSSRRGTGQAVPRKVRPPEERVPEDAGDFARVSRSRRAQVAHCPRCPAAAEPTRICAARPSPWPSGRKSRAEAGTGWNRAPAGPALAMRPWRLTNRGGGSRTARCTPSTLLPDGA